MADLLFEIGTEELPPSVVVSGEEQLEAHARRLLAETRLGAGAVETFATPRRLAVLVSGVAARQEAVTTQRRGPPVERAFDAEGNPTPAGAGFARSAGVEPSQLERRSTPQGEYVVAEVSEPGREASEVLPGLLAELVGSLSFPRSMRWDASGVRFPRPIRWLVAMLDAEVLDLRYGRLVADRVSYGHRVFHPGAVEISEAKTYEQALDAAGVVARRSVRLEMVRARATEAAAAWGGRPILRPAVVDEVTDLVERPVALVGSFDPAYLEIPEVVLTTAMESHQRYFGIHNGDGGLAPAFVVVSNADPANDRTIVAGNERVLRARLDDARFFFVEDRKTSMLERASRLGEVVLHPKLGSYLDKAVRLQALVARAAGWLGLSASDSAATALAARICKADLLTHLVFEFPELQGVVGSVYAASDDLVEREAGGATDEVATAIREHYLPRWAADELPATPTGTALALVDRLDTLVGYLGIGLAPTGSEDPFALRRAAAGFASISLARGARIPLSDAVEAAWTLYRQGGFELAPVAEVADAVGTLLATRAAVLVRDEVDRVLLDAARGGPWTDLGDLVERAGALQTLHARGGLHELAVSHERCYNLSRGGPHGDVDQTLLGHPAERALHRAVLDAREASAAALSSRDYLGALEATRSVAGPLETFFDRETGVMVMDTDPAVRRNRQALLELAASLFAPVADFSVVNPAELAEPRTGGS